MRISSVLLRRLSDQRQLGFVVSRLKYVVYRIALVFKAMTVSSITGNNTLEGNATKTFTFIANG